MRWKSKKLLEGEVKYVKCFAYFPVRIKDEYIWLEFYYEKRKTFQGLFGCKWRTISCFTKQEYEAYCLSLEK